MKIGKRNSLNQSSNACHRQHPIITCFRSSEEGSAKLGLPPYLKSSSRYLMIPLVVPERVTGVLLCFPVILFLRRTAPIASETENSKTAVTYKTCPPKSVKYRFWAQGLYRICETAFLEGIKWDKSHIPTKILSLLFSSREILVIIEDSVPVDFVSNELCSALDITL